MNLHKIMSHFLTMGRDNFAYDYAVGILLYADSIEQGILSIDKFANIFTSSYYSDTFPNHPYELTQMFKEIDSLIEIHFVCVGHSNEAFADTLRMIVRTYQPEAKIL